MAIIFSSSVGTTSTGMGEWLGLMCNASLPPIAARLRASSTRMPRNSSPWHAIADRVLTGRGYGGVLSFGLKAGREAGARLVENLGLFSHLANIGDVKSLVIHPASTTHSQLTDAELHRAGVAPELVRLSIGVEHVDDIVADLDQALAAH